MCADDGQDHHKLVALAVLQLPVQQWISAKQGKSGDRADLKQYPFLGESKLMLRRCDLKVCINNSSPMLNIFTALSTLVRCITSRRLDKDPG